MLTYLKLTNFRNHKDLRLDIGKITVIVGKNGVGKSNVLEALSLFSSCRSFREDDKKSLINLESDFSRIESDSLEIFLQKQPQFLFRAKYKGVFKKQSDFIGLLKSVVFSPETISIITGSPKNRRKFLDIMISQKSREYLRALIAYEKVRSERNSLLQRINRNEAKRSELAFWNEALIAEGTKIINERQKALNYINEKISSLYCKISVHKDRLSLIYLKTEAKDFSEELNRHQEGEIASGRTLIGPHRDDLVFDLNGVDMANFASRGEMRSAILALKICELEYLSEGSLNTPLLLLDDVFSEFDGERREHLTGLIENYQTLITTTDREFLSDNLKKESKIIELI